MPDKRDLDLGKKLVLDFVFSHIPDENEFVESVFRKRGAYARYKDLLVRKGLLEIWYEFENNAQKKALREWCKDKGIELTD